MSDVLFKPLKREALATALKKWTPASAAGGTSAVVQAQAPALAQPGSTAATAASAGKVLHRSANGATSSSLSTTPASPAGVPRGRSCSLPATLRGLLDVAPRNLLFGRKEST
jgi:hypothetical protein